MWLHPSDNRSRRHPRPPARGSFTFAGARMRGAIAGLLGLALLCGFAGSASAQLLVELKLNKKTFVAHEPVTATVVLYNRAGRDVVLRGPGRGSWLQFQVMDYDRNLISPTKRFLPEPMVLKVGERMISEVDLSEIYPVYGYGMYRIQASVFYHESEQFFDSPVVTISVADGSNIGLPFDAPPPGGWHGQGGARRFSLLKYRGPEYTEIYVRLSDARSGAVYTAFSLGQVLLFHEPQATVDDRGQFHVLYLAAPQTFAHVVIGFDGTFVGRDIYKSSQSTRPVLTMASGGLVQVRGGLKYAAETDVRNDPKTRKLSDRPSLPES